METHSPNWAFAWAPSAFPSLLSPTNAFFDSPKTLGGMSTDSSLTDMSESEGGDVEMEPPRPSAQKAYEYLLPLLDALEATLSEITLPPELRDDWNQLHSSYESRKPCRNRSKSPSWDEQAGKSTLANALLKQQVLSASAAGACTAVITEISYGGPSGECPMLGYLNQSLTQDVPTIEAVVEFISREQWAKDLAQLIEDATDTTIDNEEEAEETSASPASQARKKICEIYPHLRHVSENSWKVEELLVDPVVQGYLGTNQSLRGQEGREFSKGDQFLASTLGGSDTRAFWPLVKIVKITGPFDVLSTGITIVDLPGYGDIDPVRDRMAAGYLQNAQGVCLVAPISRAKDDSGVHVQLKKQMLSVDNEITLKPAEQAMVEELNEEVLAFTQELTALLSKRKKKEKSKAKKAATAVAEIQERTGIPQLRSYFESQGEHRNLSDAIRVVSRACEFFSRTSSTQFSLSPMENQVTARIAIDDLHERCQSRLDELMAKIQTVYHNLLVAVKKAVCKAEGKSASIFQHHNTKKWNQTMMRQEGLYQNYNLNADLTKDILADCRSLPQSILLSAKLLARGIESIVNDIYSESVAKTQEAQRLGNRFERIITELLKPQYARVSVEKGNGMYKRMKEASMNRDYIRDHASELFNGINLDIERVFAEPVKNISDDNKEKLKVFCKQLGQTIIGVEISPEFDPSGQAIKAIKAFVDLHENPTVMLLDGLKTRLQQIPST
ncbi:hypothetical protein C8F04DRAFT_1254047 [Mycena alexandri]|uniref:Dynamin N-terminal domain-containing protein n=1 Tax=Mycena alexandri TaxID=1745969 RepID=A0AAD6T7H4_9AGAR|nr:hypothetical protein C8F04DRAFT_1254047 [Mycena alexandri]